MKIGIISDIHSNIYAFKACTEYMEKHKCDEYFFLGDYISDTPYTRETMDYLYEFMENHTCYLLRGNREEYMLTQQEARKKKCTEQMWISTPQVETYSTLTGSLWIKILISFGIFQSHLFMRKQVIRPLPVVTDHRRAAGNFCS